MYVYDDNAATTKISNEALAEMNSDYSEFFGNPSSLHTPGQRAAEKLWQAREKIAACLGADPREIYFTSGGSEADNQAIVTGAVLGAKKGKKHIISTAFEHHAVLHMLKKLEKYGFEITLLDVNNNKIIAGREAESRIYPASMTKVMSLIVAVENVKDVTKMYQFTNKLLYPLYNAQASVAGFGTNEIVPVSDLFYGMILPSGADAAAALAEIVAGSEEQFAVLMNKKCEELGLKNTHFVNSTGLYDDEQYTTPSEMAMIMKYAMDNSECAKVLSTFQYTTEKTTQHPDGILLTNTMFSRMYGTEVEGVTITAGKTGYTDEALNCLVSYAVKADKSYICVTSHAHNKWHCVFDSFEIYGNYLP